MVTYNVTLTDKIVLVTGAAGFIGANLVKRLLNDFEAHKELVPMQPGNVPVTFADTSAHWSKISDLSPALLCSRYFASSLGGIRLFIR